MLYFFGSGHHTNPCDFTVIKKFQNKVNIIPVIARADIFKSEEMLQLKLDIIDTANDRNVQFFNCNEAILSVVQSMHQSPVRDILTLTRVYRTSKKERFCSFSRSTSIS